MGTVSDACVLQARVEEVGQALLWLVNDETGAALKARRLQRGPVEAYEEVTQSCHLERQ